MFKILTLTFLLMLSSCKESKINSLKDSRDAQQYKTTQIGSQVWMAENLNFETSDSWCYDNDSSNCKKYGRLYTWSSAKSSCPSGWHLPSDDEWEQLAKYVAREAGLSGMDIYGYVQLGKTLKARSMNGTDEFGFSGLPGGYRNSDGDFNDLGDNGFWWSSSEKSGSYAWYRSLHSGDDYFYRLFGHGDYVSSVRCLKDT